MNAMKLAVMAATASACILHIGAQENSAEATVAEESDDSAGVYVEASMDVLSDYLWRGTIYNGNPVWQPSATLGYDTGDFGEFYLNVWQSYDLTHKRGTFTNSRQACGIQEIDYTLAYAINLYGFDVEVGHIFYTYPKNNGPSDQDLYASIAYENDYVTPSAAAYWNYNSAHGEDPSSVYFTLGLSHDFELFEVLTLTPSASLGFGDNAWCKYVTEESVGTELTDSTIGLSASYAVTDWLSLGAQINYTWIPSHTLRKLDYMGDGKDQLVWGGFNATVSF
ncbi:MAG: hypothetical protein SPG40_05800 [Kiritimatiellia bacterium]|nr:hypothetical protein [Kiritimatiellia bacterium]